MCGHALLKINSSDIYIFIPYTSELVFPSIASKILYCLDVELPVKHFVGGFIYVRI